MSPSHLTAQLSAHAAALRHGLPSKKMQLIGVYGRDGSAVTIAALAEILKTTGRRVGIIASEYVVFNLAISIHALLNKHGGECGNSLGRTF